MPEERTKVIAVFHFVIDFLKLGGVFHTCYTCGLSNGFRKRVCLPGRSGSLDGHRRVICFETATHMPHASGRSPRGGNHGPNHISSVALCVEFAELTSGIPIGVSGREAAIAPPRPAEKLFVKSVFKGKIR